MAGMFDSERKASLMHGTKTVSEPADNLTPIGNKFLECGHIRIPWLFLLFAEIAFFRNTDFSIWSFKLFLLHS